MATKYSVEVCVCDAETGDYTPVGLFADFVPVHVLHDICETLLGNIEGACAVVAVDMDTGEIVADTDTDPDDDYWDDGCPIDDCDDDCGFDPYMGCYTDDC